MSGRSSCSECGAPLRWEKTENGRPIPLDAEPNPKGNVVLREKTPTDTRACVLRKGEETNETRYTAHFATCPYADRFRKR